MEKTYPDAQMESLKPPVTSIGVIGWMRFNLFNGAFNSILTIITLFLLWKTVPPVFKWAFVDSIWLADSSACRGGDGACWSVITANFRFIIFGFFPYESQWRPLLAMIMLFGLLFYSKDRNHWKKSLGYAWMIGLIAMGILMRGGVFGLAPVESTQWWGLQGMSLGQYEAAESIGLNYYLTMRLVILPQALKIVIPPTVSILISAFKDTSLVVIISLWDLLKTSKSILSNPEWMGYSRELYLFIAILYFLGCFSMSNYSRKLEKELSTEN